MKKQLSALIALKVNALSHCSEEWKKKHTEAIETLQNNYLPSGSGFDAGSIVDLEKSTDKSLVIESAYHHMDDGFYIGWSYFTVTITSSLWGFSIDVTPKDEQSKQLLESDYSIDYITETFSQALREKVEAI
jgi:hypothetical protein